MLMSNKWKPIVQTYSVLTVNVNSLVGTLGTPSNINNNFLFEPKMYFVVNMNVKSHLTYLSQVWYPASWAPCTKCETWRGGLELSNFSGAAILASRFLPIMWHQGNFQRAPRPYQAHRICLCSLTITSHGSMLRPVGSPMRLDLVLWQLTFHLWSPV